MLFAYLLIQQSEGQTRFDNSYWWEGRDEFCADGKVCGDDCRGVMKE